MKLNPPPGCDLRRTSTAIAEECGVSVSTAHRWKQEAKIPMRKGPVGIRRRNLELWSLLTDADWKAGYKHVGEKLGVTKQAAFEMRKRLIRHGHRVPPTQFSRSPRPPQS